VTTPVSRADIGATAPTAQVRALAAVTRHLSHDFLGGPRPLRLAWVINFQKLGTAPFVGLLMLAYGNTTAAAWIYLALHGSYGVCWVIKDVAFPDRRFQERVTVGGAVMSFALVLGLYWVAPWLLISGVLGPAHGEPAVALLAFAVALHTVGLAVMIGADAQKHFTLRERSGLITGGLFARTRHPNYLGEMMIYASYALIVRHWIPWAILAWVWGMVFYPNMRLIEASIARYPGFAEWKRRTGMVLPSLRR
jgi:steroid 5-alpha reductase family enzyme